VGSATFIHVVKGRYDLSEISSGLNPMAYRKLPYDTTETQFMGMSGRVGDGYLMRYSAI